jgi:1,4-alpha-glucan branching enzyme
MDFVLTLHSHLPWVLNHGRWPHGSDWLCEAAVDTYLPLIEALDVLEAEGTPAPITLGVTPVLANMLAHPGLATELAEFFAQRLLACEEAEAALTQSGEDVLLPLLVYWRERYRRLRRRFEACGGEPDRRAAAARGRRPHRAAVLRRHPWVSPAAGPGGSIALQLAVGVAEHERLFGRTPAGCWLPECAYRPQGDWHPDPFGAIHREPARARRTSRRPGLQFFFVDAHLPEAGRPLGLYRETGRPDGLPLTDEEWSEVAIRRSPHRTYEVSPRAGRSPVVAVRAGSAHHATSLEPARRVSRRRGVPGVSQDPLPGRAQAVAGDSSGGRSRAEAAL